MKVKRRTFPGGYRFRNFAGKPKEELVEIGIPEKAVIPLVQGSGNEVPAIVKPGESVKAGQIIGIDDNSVSNPVHSTVNGVVEEITMIEHLDREKGSGASTRKAVIVKSDGTSGWEALRSRVAECEEKEGTRVAECEEKEGTRVAECEEKRIRPQTHEWTELPREDIEEILYLSGAASLDGEGIPTRYRSSTISPDDVEHVIVRGVDSEVYNLSLRVLLGGDLGSPSARRRKDLGSPSARRRKDLGSPSARRQMSHFIEGLKILHKIIPNAEVHLAFSKYQKQLIRQIRPLIADCNWMDLFSLEPKYPQEFDEIIIPTILDKQFPYGGSAADIGVVVLSVQTVLHIYEAVVEGKPVIERIVALAGTGFRENHYVKLRIGTPLEYLTTDRVGANKEVRFVLNSPLTGMSLLDLSLPVDRQCVSIIALPEDRTRQFLTFMNPGLRRDSYSRTFLSCLSISEKECNTNMHGEERPCISCGFCDDVCPVGIIPHLVYRYVERDVIDEALLNLGISNCIECNLCNYVCPSKIPLARFIKEGMEKLIEEDYLFPRTRRPEILKDINQC